MTTMTDNLKRLVLVGLAVATLALSGCASLGAGRLSACQHWRLGTWHFQAGDYPLAARHFTAVATHPEATPEQVAGAMYWCSRIHEACGHEDRRCQCAEKLAATYPESRYVEWLNEP